jgi:hypothetical protein
MTIFKVALAVYILALSSLMWSPVLPSSIVPTLVLFVGLPTFAVVEFYNYATGKPMSIGLIYASRHDQNEKRVLILVAAGIVLVSPFIYILGAK